MKGVAARLSSARWLLAVALLLWGIEYTTRSLWEPDEARFAYVAREMRADGHWLVPHRHGVYYAHKPPLVFWLINGFASFAGGDINCVTARLHSLLGALLALWGTARLAAAWFGPAAVRPAVGVLMTAFLFWTTAGMGQMDALLCGLQVAALWLLFSADAAPAPTGRRAGAYLLMGLAILTKGPVGLLVPLAVYAAARAAAGESALLRRRHWLWGLPLALLPVGLWLGAILVTRSAPPGYLPELLFSQNVGRVAGTFAQGHHRPWWYFLEAFPRDFLPWTCLLPAAVVVLRRAGVWRPAGARLAAWIAAVLLLFSLSETKRNLYVLPAQPAAALLIAGAWSRFDRLSARARGWTGRLLAGALVTLGGALLLGPMLARHWHATDPFPVQSVAPAAVVLLVGGVLLWVRFRTALTPGWLDRLLIVLLTAQIAVAGFIYPALNPIKAPDELTRAARTYLPAGHPLLLYRMNGEIQALYAGAPGRQVWTPDALRQAMAEQKRGLVVFDARDWDAVADWPAWQDGGHPYRMGKKWLVWAVFVCPDRELKDEP